jgi:chemotaxis protein histidine kinase CheA
MPQARTSGSSSRSASSKSAAAKPASARKATAAKPAAAKPAAKPAAAKATASKPSAAKSSAAKPSSARSAATKSAAAKPAAAKPAAANGASKAGAASKGRSRVSIHVNAETTQAQVEAIAERVRKLNEKIIDFGREAGENTLTSYEKALKTIASGLSQGPAKDEIEWITHLAASQAKFVREITDSWAKAARDRLK